MKRAFEIFIVLALITVVNSVFSLPINTYFNVDEGVSYTEIQVQKDLDFTIRLPGGGWYLNRFDSETLLFRIRVTEPEYTEFLLHPQKEGRSYLFFSYMEKDVYVLVHVLVPDKYPQLEILPEIEDQKGESVGGMPAPSIQSEEVSEAGKKGKASAESDTSVSLPSSEIPTKNGAHSASDEKESLTGFLRDEERDIYYIDKEGQKVDVPMIHENDSYRRGVGNFKKGAFSQAVSSMYEYLEKCQKCDYSDEAHFILAKSHMQMGADDEAVKHLDILIRGGSAKRVATGGEPESESQSQLLKEASLYRARIEYRNERLTSALESYNTVLEYEPSNREVLKSLGDIYYQLGDYEQALPLYEQVIRKGVESDEIYFRAAKICDRPGKLRDLEKAYSYYKIVIDRYMNSEHFSYAKQRVDFLEKNFYHFR